MRNLYLILLLLFVSNIAWGTRLDDAIVEDSMTLEYCTANTVPYLDASKDVLCSAVTDTELGYLDGVTSLIQTQIDGKVSDGGTFTSGTLVTPQVDILTMSEESTPANPSSGNLKLYFKNDGNLYKLNNSGIENQVGGGGSSGGGAGKNYFSDPNTEIIGNYTPFDDGAVSVPVDGTGGSPSLVSVALKTSGQFWGTSTLEITKASGNAQGEGVPFSTDITLDKPIKEGENLYVKIRYKTSAGYSTAGENLKLFYYRVAGTTTGPFALTGTDGLGNTNTNTLNHDATGRGSFSATVQADSDTTAIRVIAMVTDSDTTPYTLEISDIKIETSATIYTPIIGECEQYTPTGGWTTNTTYYGMKCRNGDRLSLMVIASLSGAPNSVAFTLDIPDNLTMDSSKLPNGADFDTKLGTAYLEDSGTATNNTMGSVQWNATDELWIREIGGSTVGHSSPFTFASGDVVTLTVRDIPIVEWAGSGNTLNSTQQDFQNAVVELAEASTGPAIGTSLTKITYDTETKDDHNLHSSGTITWPTSQRVQISGLMLTDSETWAAGNRINVAVYKNGSIAKYIGTQKFYTGSTQQAQFALSGNIDVSAGDTLEIYAISSVATNIATGGATINQITFQGIGDYTIIGNAGVPYEYIETTAASTVATSVANTLTEAHGTSNRLTLSPGTWNICFAGTLQFTLSSGSSLYCRAFIYNTNSGSLSNIVGIPVGGYHALGSSTVLTMPMRTCAEHTITSEQTFSVGIESSEATANGNCRFASQSWTSAISNPDFDLQFSARRTK
jgi:hypothetical protein